MSNNIYLLKKSSREGDVSLQIPEEVIEKIKEQNNIVDIISEDVRLKKSGKNYTGLCPFHNDKAPSFSVSSEKQIYKCFSCGEAGNVFTFIMKYKKFNFIEAAKYLAGKANIPLQIEDSQNSKISEKKELFYKINVEAARYYYSNLQKIKLQKSILLSEALKKKP